MPEDPNKPSRGEFPYKVGMVCYRTYTEALIKAARASEVYPEVSVQVRHRESGNVLRIFQGGIPVS